jgi:hypothetical protein
VPKDGAETGESTMGPSSGFDRMSTEDELNQILEMMGELQYSPRRLPPDSPDLPYTDVSSPEFSLDVSTDLPSLAELATKPVLEN